MADNAKDVAVKAVQQDQKRQEKITDQWKKFASTFGREAYEDLMQYAEQQREMYRQYAEEREMPHPNGNGKIPIDNETVAALLQNSRGVNIMRTYITTRVNSQ